MTGRAGRPLVAITAAAFLAVGSACTRDVPRPAPAQDSTAAASGSEPASPSAAGATPGSSSYVGLSYDTPPAGVKSVGGAILSGPGVRGNYAFTHVETPRGEMIWLDTIGSSKRVVLAELTLPPLARDERLIVGSCDVAGRLEPRAIAIVVNQPGASKFTEIRQAWRVDLRAARFDIIPVAGVVCEDPGS